MVFEPGQAVVVTDEALLATYGRAFRKIGKSVVVVPLGTDLHAGHVELIRAAKSLLGAYVVVTYSGAEVPDVDIRHFRAGVGDHDVRAKQRLRRPDELDVPGVEVGA